MSVNIRKGPIVDPGVCRCCGATKKCRLLNTEYEWQGRKEIYSEMFVETFGLLLSHLDGEPEERVICATCVTRLRDSVAFRRQVLQCEQKLLQSNILVHGADAESKLIKQEKDAIEETMKEGTADFNQDDEMTADAADHSDNEMSFEFNRIANKARHKLKESRNTRRKGNDVIEILDSPPRIHSSHNIKSKTSLSKIITNNLQIQNKIEDVIQMQVTMLQNQKILLDKIDYFSTQLYDLMSRGNRSPSVINTVISNDDTNRLPSRIKTNDDITGLPIRDKKSFEQFEERLKNADFENKLTEKLHVICGKGKGRADNNAYTLIDVMFTREFMTQCSWSGGSRNNCPKVCFKTYRRTIDFFFKIIHNSDSNFTKMECEDFFKRITRNSHKRADAKRMRASTGRRRGKKYKDSTKTFEEVIIENFGSVVDNDNECNDDQFDDDVVQVQTNDFDEVYDEIVEGNNEVNV